MSRRFGADVPGNSAVIPKEARWSFSKKRLPGRAWSNPGNGFEVVSRGTGLLLLSVLKLRGCSVSLSTAMELSHCSPHDCFSSPSASW